MDAEIPITSARLVLMFALLFANGFFVAAEFSLVSVRRTRIEELIAHGNLTAQTVKHVIHDPDRFIAATQLGITIASLGLGWIAEPALAHLIEPIFGFLPESIIAPSAHLVAAGALAFVLITFLHVVVGELAPKSIALAYPERTALWVARPTILFENLFRPAIWALNGTGNGLLKLIGLRRPTGHQLVHSVEELKMLVSASMDSGELQPREKEMLHNVFAFDDKSAREVMIPRPDLITVAEDTTIAEFLQTFSETSHSRFPIYAGSIDNITGFIAIKDVLRAIASRGASALDQTVGAFVRAVLFVPETKHIGALFAEMQTQQAQIAIVIDEFGGTAGMITMEELVEEVVGSLQDEFTHEPPPIRTIDERTTQIDAQMRVEEANAQLHLALPEDEDYTTVAGLVLYTLRHIPKEGEHLIVGNLKLTVTQMDGPKIEQIQVTRL
ncbi:MAG: HlyC/CorC family transporter [Chloroflexi bacterium]|nr:HlyC/CorC family transporter [Chloroflexota bacterium]